MQSCSRGLREHCRLFGYSRQAYYQYKKVQEKQVLGEDLVIQQVLCHRKLQPRSGTCKLHEMMGTFLEDHHIAMGRDKLNELLRWNSLLLRRRSRRAPVMY